MKARQFAADIYTGIKSALRDMVRESFGPQKAAAAATRVEQGMISDYCSTSAEHAEKHVPVDVLLDLIRVSGDVRVLRYLAEQCGCILYAPPPGTRGEVGRRLGATAREYGELLTKVSEIIEDDQITEDEERIALSEIFDVMTALAELGEAVKAKRRTGGA